MQIIEGQKGGSKKPHKPYEQPDNLRSTAKLKMLIALSEGEVEGGLTPQNIFIDKTPLANPDGTYNFNGVRWEFRNGSQTQDYIKGMPEVSNELKANFIVKTDKPWVRSFSNLDLDAVRIKLSLPAHIEYRDNGDMVGTVTNYAIDLSVDGSAFETVVNGKFDGKTTSEYQRDHRINLPNAIQGWTIRVRRITPDSTSGKLVNKFGVFSYAEVIDSKFRYPNTALLYVELDASEFNGSVPLVTCRLKGKIVQVPDNYDPVSRTHSGEWNGTFKMAYTNNPAWLTHYLMRDEIAGMGDKIESAMIDKWAIYQLAQYCDQMVSDGRGGKEPRFTCNEYIQSQRDAYTVLKDLVASFRGITFWGNDQIYLTADMPQDEPDFIYHPSNVVGDFVYAGGSYKNRYTSCMVAYSDPDNHYCDDVETVWDHDLMRRYDVNVMKLTAIGCTSQSEAQRRGRWALLSNVKDGVATFTVGLDGYIPLPARIIGIADPSRSGKENGGRIHAVSGRKITLDRPVDYDVGDRLVINLPDGTAQSRTIKSISDDKRTITVTANYKIPPVVGAVWCIDSDNVAIQYYRVTGISARENQQFTITAIQHDPDKFKYIDDGVRLEPKPITVTPPSSISPPKNIIISESSYVSQGLSVASLEVSWDQVEGATNYVAQWRKDNCNWINVGQTNGTGFTVNGIYSGVYDVRVRAINAIEVSSPWAYSAAKSIKGKVGKPDKPINFTASDDVVFGINLNWSFPQGSSDTSHTEIQYSTNENEDNALLLSNVTYPSFSYSQTGLSIGQVFFYRARLVDKIGNTSDWTEWVRGISSTNANDLTDHILDEITGTDAWNSLIESTSSSVNSAIENAKSIIENALANDRETKRRRIENGKLSAEITETNAVLLNEKEATAIALKELKSNFGDVSSNLSELRQTTAEQNSATSKSIDSLTAKVGAVSSDLSQFKQVTTNQNSATAQAIQSINTTVGDVSTSISDVSKTVNNLDGKISAYRTMKIAVDNKGQQYVAGMTMGVENTDQGMQSNVIFLADKFMVMNQANGIPVPAFIVKDGNVIMNSAVFGHASINFATISDTIQSENYVPNKSGWKLFKNGTFEINSTFMDGGRVILNSDGLAVYDEMGVLRVLLGKLWR
ncbi:host specificity protein J [Gilliamella apicola]|uniref:host specificity protein J n=1 Tax=Gilliamella apicola TaxID=1196095 RepID=UPI000A3539E2|nr:phage tail protein [Gilliamella apicola]